MQELSSYFLICNIRNTKHAGKAASPPAHRVKNALARPVLSVVTAARTQENQLIACLRSRRNRLRDLDGIRKTLVQKCRQDTSLPNCRRLRGNVILVVRLTRRRLCGVCLLIAPSMPPENRRTGLASLRRQSCQALFQHQFAAIDHWPCIFGCAPVCAI